MNDFLLARVAVIWADTPKSAMERKERGKKKVGEGIRKKNEIENNRG